MAENNRKARYYAISRQGCKQHEQQSGQSDMLTAAVAQVLEAS